MHPLGDATTGVLVVLSMSALIGALAYILVSAVKDRTPLRLGARQFRNLGDLIAQVARATGLEGRRLGVTPKLANATFAGEIARRSASLSFPSEHDDAYPDAPVRFSVASDTPAEIKIALEGWRDAVARVFLGPGPPLQTGDPEFDDHFVLDAPVGRNGRAREALHREELRDAIRGLFGNYPVERLEIAWGRVAAVGPLELADPARAADVFKALVKIADRLDRRPITVRVLGGERRALKSMTGAARCSYCHADVTGEEPDLVACERCSTVLHAGCWEELGRCPVLGCVGDRPERARVN